MPLLTVLYAVAIFLGSFLLFLIEPIAGKKLLPSLGGSAAVWTTCLVFFQTALLCGYLLAHWMATRLRARAQTLVYSGLLLAALLQCVFSLRSDLHASTADCLFWFCPQLIRCSNRGLHEVSVVHRRRMRDDPGPLFHPIVYLLSQISVRCWRWWSIPGWWSRNSASGCKAQSGLEDSFCW